jgi:hypothetical protein
MPFDDYKDQLNDEAIDGLYATGSVMVPVEWGSAIRVASKTPGR